MKKNFYLLFLAVIIGFSGCNSCSKKNHQAGAPTQDSIILSFAFVGCNRVQDTDSANVAATGGTGSAANYFALQRIFNNITDSLPRRPDILFFLGDLVSGQTTTQLLDYQLGNWVKLYSDTNFSKISKSGIELVAVPGNHEMLYINGIKMKIDNIKHDEWPLKGATDIWMKNMSPYMPADREKITGKTDSAINQMSFSFVRNNTAFIVMNTDTYDDSTAQLPYGLEGKIPYSHIVDRAAKYSTDTNIKHIFVLGHKPCYVDDTVTVDHEGLPDAPKLWPVLQKLGVCAMLSAHNHTYQRMQPGGSQTYQVIAGNGGSYGPTSFFGYSLINIYSSGRVQLISKGYNVDDSKSAYYLNVPTNYFYNVDTTSLIWGANANPYTHNYFPSIPEEEPVK